VYFPGAFGFFSQSSARLGPEGAFLEFLAASGRALMWPIYDGTFERARGDIRGGYAREDRIYRTYAIRWAQDFMRAVDYLETRSEIDTIKLAYLGNSWGSQNAPAILSVDRRITAAVLWLAGLPMQRSLPEVDPINFVGHVRAPVLMISGQYDYIYPVELSQRPLFNLLGTAPADKRHVVIPGMGHGTAANRNDLIRETLAWLDKYLGPVQ
jgi:dipeptidyl aminopeptidase/acylaminoacyl peptidase